MNNDELTIIAELWRNVILVLAATLGTTLAFLLALRGASESTKLLMKMRNELDILLRRAAHTTPCII